MMNPAFAAAGVDGVYLALKTPAEDLEGVVGTLKTVGFGGGNVTAPHKERVAQLVDRLSPGAELSGSVNTLVWDGDILVGHNTDGSGLVRAIEEGSGVSLSGARILLLGAGGAARGVIPALLHGGAAEICLANRTEARARELAERFDDLGSIVPLPLEDTALFEKGRNGALDGFGIVINATSARVEGGSIAGLDLSRMSPGSLFFDMNYYHGDDETAGLLKKSDILHAKGLDMLLFQGVDAFELWTGAAAPVAIMRRSLTRSE
jgi:shikimate dehydrogenase